MQGFTAEPTAAWQKRLKPSMGIQHDWEFIHDSEPHKLPFSAAFLYRCATETWAEENTRKIYRNYQIHYYNSKNYFRAF